MEIGGKQEGLALSEEERDRLKVLHDVARDGLRQWQGAAQCGMTERAFSKLLKRYRVKGDAAVVHAFGAAIRTGVWTNTQRRK